MSRTAADVFSGGGGEDWVAIKDLVGDTITVTDFKVRKGKFGYFPVIQAVTNDGDELNVRGGKHLIEKLEEAQEVGLFPVELKVVSFPTDYGNDGYGLEPVDA